MLIAGLHLVIRSWFAMVAGFSTSTLGFLAGTFSLTLCIWLIQLAVEYHLLKGLHRGFDRFNRAVQKTGKLVLIDMAGISLFVLLWWAVFVVRTVYFDHSGLVYANSVQKTNSGQSSILNEQEIAKLRAQVEFQRNNISVRDPVFINIRDLLQAFGGFRVALNKEPCFIKVTAPAETEPFAAVVANFSIATSNCQTFGPTLGETDPDELTAITRGMIPDAIVFHAARDDRAANDLFVNLGNRIKLVRSYDLPKVGVPASAENTYQHLVWLQFGSNVRWNSEIHE